MSFGHPLFLFLALAPCVWIAYCWRAAVRKPALVLKGLGFAAIAVALAEPSAIMPRTRAGVVVLADTSGSISQEDLERASSITAEVEQKKGGNWVRVVPFASETRSLQPAEISGGLHLVHTAGEAADGTNLEAALLGSTAAIPSGYIPRVLLISDGNENEGSAARAIAELQTLHVPVDTVPLAGRSTSLRLESLSVPREAYAGEQIPLDLTIWSPAPGGATVDISAEGKNLGSNPIRLEDGLNLVRIHARLNSSGATAISGRIVSGTLGNLPFEQAIELKRAKVLFLSQDPSGVDENFLEALKNADLEVTRDTKLIDKDLNSVQLVILNNLDLNVFSEEEKLRLESYVQSGGGLLLIGGERQVYKPDSQLDALDRVLPAKLAPPQTPQGTSVALIIDKSSSMEGRKIELARLSAIGVVDHLRPVDSIGVLIFDNSYQWAVPMRRAQDKSLIKRLISGITPDGGTQIAPALTEAYRRVLPSKATYKHIVLLTDGISEEGDSIELAREAANHEVTISTVGLGQDVNRSYLEKIAATSGGRSYFLNDPQGLEQILLRDVQDYSGSTAIERALTPIIERPAEILDGTGMETAPPLRGYARFVAKPGAERILGVGSQRANDEVAPVPGEASPADEPAILSQVTSREDPLYVRWQYGLGRAAVFTSDAKSRWAEAWVTWPGFDKFWINVTRDLLTHTGQTEARAHYDSANGDIQVSYRLSADLKEPVAVPQIFVVGPRGFEQRIDIERTANHLYRGRLHIGRASGLFRIRPVTDSAVFPEIGFYRQHQEASDHGSNEA
ncbi:MAG TPA: VWA domain-containing protein, partial [Bryobacteraceae bacterium]